jgi:hypothetical protein
MPEELSDEQIAIQKRMTEDFYQPVPDMTEEEKERMRRMVEGFTITPEKRDISIGEHSMHDDFKNLAQGGQVNRPGYKFGGGIDWSQVTAGSNTGGFDSSGGEKLWQAKTVANTDPGVYKKGWFGGSSLTDMGQDINRMVGNRNTKGTDYFQSYPISGNREKFFEEYPNIPQTFNPFENKMSDIEEQKLLSEEAPEGYTYAQGGIADLDMRGGGESIGPGTGTSDDVPAMLSDGEFVMTANAVSNLGGGDRMLGAQRMYNMMNSLDPNSQSPGEMNVAGYG